MEREGDGEPLPLEEMMSFWVACSFMLLSEEGIQRIVTDSAKFDRPLHLQAIEYQRDIMEYNFGIERVWGCYQIGKIQQTYPDATASHQGAGNFMRVAMYSFVEQLKCRRRMAGGPLRSSGGLTRHNLLEFFEGCNAAMSLDATKKAMSDVWRQTQDVKEVGKVAISVQHKILNLIGVTVAHGIEVLNRIQVEYKDDQELADKFSSFQLTAEMSVRMASMTPAEVAQLLEEVPPYMHAVPHVYFTQKQRMMNLQQRQQQAMREAQMANPEVRMQQQRMLDYMNTEAGQDRIFGIVKRIKDAKPAIEERVKEWDGARRHSFFAEFSSSAFLGALLDAGSDTIRRMEILDRFSAEELDSLITMQSVFAADARSGGSLMTKLRSDASMAGVGSAIQTLGLMHKLSQFEKGAKFEVDNGHDHGHGHGHGHAQEHVHGPGCNHGPPAARAPDVSKGKADVIER
jgi:hypothetical protein